MLQLHGKRSYTLSLWLRIMCLGIIAMIFIGGLTRLTESGLSITEWNVVSGVIPPLDSISWNEEFDKYKQSPEYIKHNMGMSLSEFKSIYMLEFIHRLAGRVVSILYVIPLMIFLGKGYIRGRQSAIYIVALLLLATQGVMGWYMVKSGLVSNPYVSHYRLAAHLMFAVFLYMILFWQLMKNSFDIMLIPIDTPVCKVKFWSLLSIVLLLIQMMLGAFVAGLNAGLVYNSFPLMGDNFVPHEISNISLSIKFFSEPVFVQFIHRMMAYLLFSVICIFSYYGLSLGNSRFSRVVIYVILALIFQMLIGILTLLYDVPISLALLHQFGAVLLLSFLLWGYFMLKSTDSS